MFLDGSLSSLAIWTLERASSQQKVMPQSQMESQLVQIWQRVLGIASISTEDNFFELGGDSLKAAIVAAEVEKLVSWEMPLASLVEAPTIKQLAALLDQRNGRVKARSLVPIRPDGHKRPFFYVHGGSDPTLANYLHFDRPFYGLQAIGLNGEQHPYTRMEDIITHYIQEIQTVQPEGPYLLGGRCTGGNIAIEMAQELKKQGQQVLLVVMADSPNPWITEEHKNQTWNYWLTSGKQDQRKTLIGQGLSIDQVENILKVSDANYQMVIYHLPQIYSGRVVHFFAEENRGQSFADMFDPMKVDGWNDWVEGGIQVIEVPGRHGIFHNEPYVQVLAEKMNACLEQVD